VCEVTKKNSALLARSPLLPDRHPQRDRAPKARSYLSDGRLEVDTDDIEKPLFLIFSGWLGFGWFVPPSFDYAGVGSLCVSDQFHLAMSDLLDPIVSP
jgi:hypothetical protein